MFAFVASSMAMKRVLSRKFFFPSVSYVQVWTSKYIFLVRVCVCVQVSSIWNIRYHTTYLSHVVILCPPFYLSSLCAKNVVYCVWVWIKGVSRYWNGWKEEVVCRPFYPTFTHITPFFLASLACTLCAHRKYALPFPPASECVFVCVCVWV